MSDTTPPTLSPQAPAGGAVTVPGGTTAYTVRVAAADPSGVASVQIGGAAAAQSGGVWQRAVALAAAALNVFGLAATDAAGNTQAYIPVTLARGYNRGATLVTVNEDITQTPATGHLVLAPRGGGAAVALAYTARDTSARSFTLAAPGLP